MNPEPQVSERQIDTTRPGYDFQAEQFSRTETVWGVSVDQPEIQVGRVTIAAEAPQPRHENLFADPNPQNIIEAQIDGLTESGIGETKRTGGLNRDTGVFNRFEWANSRNNPDRPGFPEERVAEQIARQLIINDASGGSRVDVVVSHPEAQRAWQNFLTKYEILPA